MNWVNNKPAIAYDDPKFLQDIQTLLEHDNIQKVNEAVFSLNVVTGFNAYSYNPFPLNKPNYYGEFF